VVDKIFYDQLTENNDVSNVKYASLIIPNQVSLLSFFKSNNNWRIKYYINLKYSVGLLKGIKINSLERIIGIDMYIDIP
jgi:hypothetical protein